MFNTSFSLHCKPHWSTKIGPLVSKWTCSFNHAKFWQDSIPFSLALPFPLLLAEQIFKLSCIALMLTQLQTTARARTWHMLICCRQPPAFSFLLQSYLPNSAAVGFGSENLSQLYICCCEFILFVWSTPKLFVDLHARDTVPTKSRWEDKIDVPTLEAFWALNSEPMTTVKATSSCNMTVLYHITYHKQSNT